MNIFDKISPTIFYNKEVMNTREELARASRDLDNGHFIKNKKDKYPEQINKFYQKD